MQPSDFEKLNNTQNDGKHYKNTGWKIHLKYCSRIIGVLLFVAAIYVVQKEFKHLSLKEIKLSFEQIPTFSLLMAGACTLLSFFVLSFYDKMAVRQIGYRLSFLKTAFASFCSYVLSHNIGLSAVSGAMVRFRLYGSWGLKPLEILQVIAFCSITYFIGVAVLVGALLIFKSNSLPIIGQALPDWIFIFIGIVAWLGVFGYIFLSFRCNTLKVWKYTLSFPRPSMAISQIVVATAEVIITAAIPYCVVPSHSIMTGYPALDFMSFMAIYIASYIAGLISSVPGGAGVFEGSMILALKNYMPMANIMCVIFVFRFLYYLIPLFIAGSMFAVHEILIRSKSIFDKPRKKNLLRFNPSLFIDENLRESDAAFSVAIAAAAVFICALIDLAVPLFDSGLILHDAGTFSLFIELTGDYILSFLGLILLTLTVSLVRRITLAWGLSLCILIASAVITLIMGTYLIIPAILTLVAFFIAPFRKCYYRSASLTDAPFSSKIIVEVILFLTTVLIINWLIPQSIAQYGVVQVFFSGNISIATKIIIAVVGISGILILFKLMLPAKIVSWPWSGETKELYRVMSDTDNKLLDDIKPNGILICSKEGTAIPFIRKDNFLVGIGDPVGNEREIVNTIWRLRDLALQENRSIGFWGAGKKYLTIYHDFGLASLKLDKTDHFVCCEVQYASFMINLIGKFKKS